MKKKHRRWAESFATEWIGDFINHPEYRGEKFTWEQFPSMVERFARVHSDFVGGKQSTTEERVLIGKLAKAITERELKEKKLM